MSVEDVYIHPSANISEKASVGAGTKVWINVQIRENAEWQITPTRIGNGASIGANATIVCGITIGEFAMVAAGSVVTKDVTPYTLVMGNPARAVARIDRAGNRIDGEI